MEEDLILNEYVGFCWDKGNLDKNWQKHGVTVGECEQVFFNKPLLFFEDNKHSQLEQRIYVLGQTDVKRKLFVVFTRRGDLVRVISARDMSKKERRYYEQAEKTSKI